MTCRGTSASRAPKGPHGGFKKAALPVLAACLLSGCSLHRVSLDPQKAAGEKQVSLSVPFFPDNTDQCGPSALASVLEYWGKPEAPERLRAEIYRAGLKGSLTVDLLLAAGSRGLSAEMVEGGLPRLRAELDAGRPLIAFVNAGFSFYPVGHYLVITGYDDRRRCILAHSGMKRDQRIPYGKFEKQWKQNGQWALLILPPQL